jgi:hypothetical protein
MGIEASRSRGTRSLFKCDPHSCWNVKLAFKDVDVRFFLAFHRTMSKTKLSSNTYV